jgi:Zn-dependent protease/CBS domain-containing protein
MMRLLGRLLLVSVLGGVLLLAFGVLAVSNAQPAQINLGGVVVQAALGLIVAGAVALGMVLAVLLLLPGRVRVGRRGQILSQYAELLEDEVRNVRQRIDGLRSNGQVQASLTDHVPPPAALPRTGPILPPRVATSIPQPDYGQRRLAEVSPDPAPPLLATAGPLPAQARGERTTALPGSIVVGRIAGIQIAVHASWLIIVALLTASLATTFFPRAARGLSPGVYWLVGLGATLLLFASVLIHELGHSLVARARGLPVSSITLFIFGGVSNLEQEPRSPGEEFVVAAIGPALSLVVGGLLLALALLSGHGNLLLQSLLVYLGSANVLLGVFNLLPGFPLDGGRVLRAILWKITGSLQTATRWAARVGQGLAFLLILLGVWQFFMGNILTGIWIGFIGWFMLNAAQSANTQVALDATLRGVAVAQAMSAAPPSRTGDHSVQAVVDELIWPYGLSGVLVEEAGHLVGLVTPADIRRLPRDLWAQTPVAQVMTPIERLLTTAPRQPLSAALALMATHAVDQLLVVQKGMVVGLLTRDAVMRLVEARRGLEPPQSAPRSGVEVAGAGATPPDLPVSA